MPSAPLPPAIGATETGIASWYGKPYDGRRAASGEIYDMQQLTAAHRTLPFNTWVEVTDLDNGKRVDVRINDRGPFIDGRVIDLSLAAARAIEMVAPGTARVRLTVIAPPDPAPSSSAPPGDLYAVQAGAFSDPERARAFAAALEDQYKDTVVIESVVDGQTVWKVLAARNLSLDDANRLSLQVKEAIGEALVVRNP
ncbi:MAG TPA: septal ring lytic transglycosylase RlpA family protein [Bryobacteraceae bacterium]|nr:septal ring lytic transglycosylase RlpA family protein [Bryobacteraceae bacterium]